MIKKKLNRLIILFFCISLGACGSANRINGSSLKTANKSVAFIKEHLAAGQRLEFEVAYWELRRQIKDDKEFLKAIDQKNVTDIIQLGKEYFTRNKAAGLPETAQFDSWDQMIAKEIEQRKLQNAGATEPKDKKGYPSVDYKLHSM